MMAALPIFVSAVIFAASSDGRTLGGMPKKCIGLYFDVMNTTPSNLLANADQFDGLMIISDYYLCFLSEANYLAYRTRSDGFFVSLAPYVGDAEVTYYEGATDAVYLHSTAFGQLPGFENLDESTVICLRSVSEVARRADRKGSAKKFAAAEKTLKNIFAVVSTED